MRRRFNGGVDLRAPAAEKSQCSWFLFFSRNICRYFSGAILSATNNSMAGGKLQLRDEKRFEQPQLASSQAIGVIGFPFEAIGKRFFIVANLQLRGLGGKIAVDRNSNADCRTKFQWRESR